MRTLLLVSAATVAFATGAFAQFVDRTSGSTIQGPTAISQLCGVNYAMTDPDPNIRLEMWRDCASAGLEGGAD
jgi:hypothetical protein